MTVSYQISVKSPSGENMFITERDSDRARVDANLIALQTSMPLCKVILVTVNSNDSKEVVVMVLGRKYNIVYRLDDMKLNILSVVTGGENITSSLCRTEFAIFEKALFDQHGVRTF